MIKQLFSATALNTIGFGLGFFTQLLLARLLSVEQFGLFSFFFALNMTLGLIALCGFPQAVMRLIPGFSTTGQTKNLWWFTLLLCTALILFLGALAYGALYHLHLPAGASTALYVIAAAPLIPLVVLRLQSGMLKGLERPLSAIFYEITGREALLLYTLILCAYLGFNLRAVHVFALLGVVLSILAILAMAHSIRLIRPAPAHIAPIPQNRDWTLIALPMMLTAFAQMLLHRTDILMIGLTLTPEETGIYGLAAKLTQIVAFPVMAMGAVFSPLAARLYQDGDKPALRALFNKNRAFLIGITALLCAALAGAAPYILLLFGEGYIGAYHALLILLAGNFLNAIWGPVVPAMIMSVHERIAMVVTLAATALNITLNVWMIPRFGIEGAAIATVISINLKNAALTAMMYRYKLLGG